MTAPIPDESRLLLLTKPLASVPAGGRELLCRLNYDALKAIYGDRLVLFELPEGKFRKARDYFKVFKGHIDGLNDDSIEEVVQTVEAGNIDKVFVDGSNLGAVVTALKRRLPHVEVTSFFHNVEARFFWGALRFNRKVRAVAVLLANYIAERQAVAGSDKLVCLSERDSRQLKRLYGRAATHIAPMALDDKLPADFAATPETPPESFALFVGGVFYANQAGIAWYIRHVAPKVDVPLFIVGRGFESLRGELEIPGKVTVVGEVDSLEDWYRRAKFVIAPIFDGSGMKTKVAEALMHGKMVVGSAEAFSGYEDVASEAGWLCHTANEFAAAIVQANDRITAAFHPKLREIYLRRYSKDAAARRLRDIVG